MSRHGVRKTSVRGSTSQKASHRLCGQSKASSDPAVSHSDDTPLHDCLPVTGDDTGYAGDTQFPAPADETVAALSATPPLAESDLQPLPAFEQELAGPSRLRPSPLDTSSVQDASLPSPSLSPITAAANLHDHIGFGSSLSLHTDPNARYSPNAGTSEHGSRAQDVSMVRRRHVSTKAKHIEMPPPIEGCSPNPQLPTPTLMDIPTILDSFDGMPTEMQTYVMYQLLRRCAKPTLHFVADVVNPALKCDFLGLLPLELSLNIVKHFDVKTMCRAAQVSKKWRQIIDSDEKAWKDLLDGDGHVIPEGEVVRAVKEGWGWQFPQDSNSWERDLSAFSPPRSDAEASPRLSSSSLNQDDSESTVISSRTSIRLKRKATGKCCTNKRQKRKVSGESTVQATIWSRSLDMSQGPNAFANAAALAVPNPQVGLPSLRNLHLFKSLYQRHHSIRESWMNESIKPHHLAFRAHQQHVVTCLQFDTDKILSGSDDTNINVYDTKTGAMRKVLKGHEGGVWALQYEGNTLVSGSTDRSVRVWDIEKGKCLQVFQGHTSTVRCLVILKPTEIGKRSDGNPIIMPKEPLIITGSRDSSLRVWKLPQPGDRSVFQTGPPANDYDNPYFIRALTGHHHSVRAIAAHGDTLISGSYDFTVRVWKISTGDTVHRLQGHSQKVYSVVLDHKRNRCISGSMDNLVKVWSLETGACLFNLEGHSSLVGLLDLSHDRLVSAAADSTLRIWDPENGQCKSTLSAHTGAITCFQHDGQKVISGSDRTLKMWNVQNGTCIRDLLTELSGVWQVKFNERRCVAAVQRNQWTYIEVRTRPQQSYLLIASYMVNHQLTASRSLTLAPLETACQLPSAGYESSSTKMDMTSLRATVRTNPRRHSRVPSLAQVVPSASLQVARISASHRSILAQSCHAYEIPMKTCRATPIPIHVYCRFFLCVLC